MEQDNLQAALREAAEHLPAGRTDKAEALSADLLDRFPDNAEVLKLLGYLACTQGRYREGVDYLRRSVAEGVGAPETHCYLGNAHLRLGEHDLARQSFGKALELDPRNPEAHYGLGESLRIEGDFAAAERAYKQAIVAAPEHWPAAAELANLYERANRLDEVREILAEALPRAPDYPLLNLLAAKLERRDGRPQDAIARLSALLDRKPAARTFRRIHFELGRLCHSVGNYTAAFDYYLAGNELAREQWTASHPDPNEVLGDAEQMLDVLTPEWLGVWSRPPQANLQARPVFLVGFPRSGTTLLDQVLDSHPDIQVIEEQPTLRGVEKRLRTMPGSYPDSLAMLNDEQFRELLGAYYRSAGEYTKANDARVLVDKLPLNLARAVLIHRLFPNGRFIFAVRHPCDVVLSCLMQNFSLNQGMANFFTTQDAVRLYDRLMVLWERTRQLLPLEVCTVRYEDLVLDLEHEARRLVEFLELDWDPAMLVYHEHAQRRGWIGTPSYHQVSRPVYSDAVDRWKCYADRLDPFMNTLQPHIKRFGY